MKANSPAVALFIPCYVDQFYPQVGIATLELLEKLGCTVTYPSGQTCCGQPLANAGYARDTVGTATHFIETFSDYDYVVCPSGSCTLHVKEHFPAITGLAKEQEALEHKIFELVEFITDVLKIEQLEGKFPHRVSFHSSCHGQRGLHLSSGSELNQPPFNKARKLLENLEGLDWVELTRTDECCGFGGTFAVTEEALSIQMGKDRLADHLSHKTEIITGGDMSCIMHLQGITTRSKQEIKFLHLAEILNQALS